MEEKRWQHRSDHLEQRDVKRLTYDTVTFEKHSDKQHGHHQVLTKGRILSIPILEFAR